MIVFDKEKFSERLKKAVKNAGGNDTVAKKTGIRTGNISRYTNGHVIPSAELLALIASACEVSTDYLLNGKEIVVPADEQVTKELIAEAGRVAMLMAKRSKHINLDPEAFGQSFINVLSHTLKNNQTSEEASNVIQYEFGRIAKK